MSLAYCKNQVICLHKILHVLDLSVDSLGSGDGHLTYFSVPPYFLLVDVSSDTYLDSGSSFWARALHGDAVDILLHHSRRHPRSGCPTFSHANIGQLFQEVKA